MPGLRRHSSRRSRASEARWRRRCNGRYAQACGAMTGIKRRGRTFCSGLRHGRDGAGLVRDDGGWAGVAAELAALATRHLPADRATLDRVLAENDKQRFEYSPDGRSIRARQGHSVEVEGAWEKRDPPEVLFHGTIK